MLTKVNLGKFLFSPFFGSLKSLKGVHKIFLRYKKEMQKYKLI